jgi:formamidopyrimidine-DNA glycosylase
MPELPDLQVFSYNLNKILKGKNVTKIDIPVAKKLNVSKAALKKSISNKKLLRVYREGKELYFGFEKDNTLGLHLMLHGELHLVREGKLPKNVIIWLEFNKGDRLVLTDWQKAAVVTFNPTPGTAPDALSKDLNFRMLRDKLAKTKGIIKNVLLDQKIIRGIGNAYADEILWDAGISPFSSSNKIPVEKIRALIQSIKKVLKNAEKQIRRSDPDRITGELRDFLAIHNSRKKESPKGARIKTDTRGGRKTYYTDEQVLYT